MTIYGRFFQVSNGVLGSSQWGVPYADLVQARANGFFPVVYPLPEPHYDPTTQRLIETSSLQGDVVVVTFSLEDLTTEDSVIAKRTVLAQKLAASESEFKTRWLEDISNDVKHSSFISWKAKRESLRSQLSALPAVEVESM